MRPVTIFDKANVLAALTELERASHEADLTEIAQAFTADTASFTPTFQLNTITPSAANIANFLATLLTAMQKGGTNRTT